MSWQQRLKIASAALFVGILVAIAWSLRTRAPETAAPAVRRVDPSAAVELPQGADIIWTEKGREVFTLKFGRALTYADGRSLFTAADVTLPDRGGRGAHVTSKEAEVFTLPGKPRRVELRGDVVITTSDGLKLTTDAASYAENERILRIPGAFSFTRGRTAGSGNGGTYDQDADLFVILDAARVTVAPGAQGDPPMNIEAGTATMDRREHVTRFERHARVTAGAQSTESETLVAFLTPDNERISRIELRGGSRVTQSDAGPGALRGMQAQEIDLTYGDDGRTLRQAQLRGGSALEIAGNGPEARRLAAETIDTQLGEDGRTVQQLAADQRVQLDLPGEGEMPARRIQSSALRGAGDANGLRDVTFTGAVRYREVRPPRATPRGRPPAPAAERTAESDRLDATLAPGLGAPEAAVFRGRVRIRDGSTTAEAGVANYAPARNLLLLETPPGAQGSAPRVADQRVTVSARWIELTLEPSRLQAKGDVRSVLQQESDDAPASGARRRPAMLRGREPVNVTAEQLQYDGDASRGTYTGGARLWQGETTIQADEIVIDEEAGNLAGTGAVRTRMMIEREDAKTKQTEVTESIGSAETFVYEDEQRRATYTGSAHLTGPQGDLTARKIELFLNDDGRTLNRAEAYDEVVARLQGGQQAFGARLTYYGADERYVVTGSPVRIFEPVEGGCRESLGASLTFIRSTDTISIVGTEGNRSRTMPGSCPERVR